MKRFLKHIKWALTGRPCITYRGFHCGICGKWVDMTFEIPKYCSAGEWWDTWGLCNKCLE